MNTTEEWTKLEQKFLKLADENIRQPKLAEHYLKMAARASQERIRGLQTAERKNTNRDRRLISIRKWANIN
ncbi:hypothetical protein LEP3755_30610 [Leptolyngbya sp. NIES-3755]|nr:hypothetical protein LEP3755_30610 [Leptolyngbya sp. NIES-3755]